MLGRWGRAKAMVAVCATTGKGSDGESDGGGSSSREGDERTQRARATARRNECGRRQQRWLSNESELGWRIGETCPRRQGLLLGETSMKFALQ